MIYASGDMMEEKYRILESLKMSIGELVEQDRKMTPLECSINEKEVRRLYMGCVLDMASLTAKASAIASFYLDIYDDPNVRKVRDLLEEKLENEHDWIRKYMFEII